MKEEKDEEEKKEEKNKEEEEEGEKKGRRERRKRRGRRKSRGRRRRRRSSSSYSENCEVISNSMSLHCTRLSPFSAKMWFCRGITNQQQPVFSFLTLTLIITKNNLQNM